MDDLHTPYIHDNLNTAKVRKNFHVPETPLTWDTLSERLSFSLNTAINSVASCYSSWTFLIVRGRDYLSLFGMF